MNKDKELELAKELGDRIADTIDTWSRVHDLRDLDALRLSFIVHVGMVSSSPMMDVLAQGKTEWIK